MFPKTTMDFHDTIDMELRDTVPKSDYIDPDNVVLETPQSYRQRVFHANIQSLPSKLTDLKILLSSLHKKEVVFDYILLCGTWLNKYNEYCHTIPNYKIIPNSRSAMAHGGVCIFIKEGIE